MKNNVNTLKQALRAEKRTTRKQFVDELPESVRNLVFMQPPAPVKQLLQSAHCTGLYVSMPYEAPTQRYIEFADAHGLSIALPWFSNKASEMVFRSYSHGDTLEAGPFGIMQPEETAKTVYPDLLIMPLLAFNDDLQRLGQGGGHYDRYLETHPDTKTIGIAWSVQQTDNIPLEPHDKQLDMIVTQSSFMLREGFEIEETR